MLLPISDQYQPWHVTISHVYEIGYGDLARLKNAHCFLSHLCST